MSQQDTNLLKGIFNSLGASGVLYQKLDQVIKNVEKTSQQQQVAQVATGNSTTVVNNTDILLKETNKKLDNITNVLARLAGSTSSSVNGLGLDSTTIKGIGMGVSSISSGLVTFTLVPQSTIQKFLTFITGYLDVFSNSSTSSQATESAKTIEIIGGSIGGLSSGLIKIAMNPFVERGVRKVGLVIQGIMKVLADVNTNVDGAVKGAEALTGMITFLRGFLVAIAGAALASVIALAAMPLIAAAVGGLGLIFTIVGLAAPQIAAGAMAMTAVASGLRAFAGGIALAALAVYAIATIEPGLILAIPLVIGAYAGIFALIGMVDGKIKQGSRAMIWVGLGLAGISLGLLVFAEMVERVGKKLREDNFVAGIAKVGLVVGGIALVFGLLGVADNYIIKGSIAAAAMGLGLWALSIGLGKFIPAIQDIDVGKGFKAALVIGGLGLTFAGLGQFWVSIGKGLLVGWAMSYVLGELGPAIKKFTEDVENVGLEQALKGIGAILTIALTFAAVGNPITVGFTLMGAAAMATVGLSISSVAKGIRDWNDTVSESDLAYFIPNSKGESVFFNVIRGIASGFAAAGTDSPSPNLLSMLTGIELGPNNVSRGISSVLDAGDAMKSVGEGLVAFNDLTKKIPQGLGEFDSQKRTGSGLIFDVFKAVTMVNAAFASIGMSSNTNNSLLGVIFGTDFKDSDTEEGIDSVMGTGDALKSVAMGLIEFSKLSDDIFGGGANTFKVSGDIASGGGVLSKIFNTITAVRMAFGEVGKKDNGTNWMKLFSGADMGATPTERGIASVRDLGKILTGVAEGLTSFANINNIKLVESYDSNGKPIYSSESIPLTKIISNIQTVFSDTPGVGILSVFKQLGENEDFTSGFMGIGGGEPKGPISRGVKSLQGIGEILSGVAEAFKIFSEKNVQDSAEEIKKQIASIVTGIIYIFSNNEEQISKFQDITGNDDFVTGFENVIDILTKITNLNSGGKEGESAIYAAMIGAGDGLKYFIEATSSLGNTLIKSLGNNGIAKLVIYTAQFEKMAKAADKFEKFVKSFTQFSKDTGVFVKNLNTLTNETTSNFVKISDSLDKLSKIDVKQLTQVVELQTAVIKNDREAEEIKRAIIQPPTDPAVTSVSANPGTEITKTPETAKPVTVTQSSNQVSIDRVIIEAVKAALTGLTISEMKVMKLVDQTPK